MKNKKVISTIILVVLIVAIVVAVIVVKSKQTSSNKPNAEISNKEDQIIQTIRTAFDELRTDFVVDNATVENYHPNESHEEDGNQTGTAFNLKNIIVSNLGENVIDESQNNFTEMKIDDLILEAGNKVDITDGYHVYLSTGEEDDEKTITIVYKDSVFCNGMAHYDTENNIVADNSNGCYPVLVAQIKLTSDDAAYYLEPMKSVK